MSRHSAAPQAVLLGRALRGDFRPTRAHVTLPSKHRARGTVRGWHTSVEPFANPDDFVTQTERERTVEPYFIIIGGLVVVAGIVWTAVRKARG